MTEWDHHFLVVHGMAGNSVKFYPLLTIEQEMDALVEPT